MSLFFYISHSTIFFNIFCFIYDVCLYDNAPHVCNAYESQKKKAREIVRSPETGVKDSCEPACEC